MGRMNSLKTRFLQSVAVSVNIKSPLVVWKFKHLTNVKLYLKKKKLRTL